MNELRAVRGAQRSNNLDYNWIEAAQNELEYNLIKVEVKSLML